MSIPFRSSIDLGGNQLVSALVEVLASDPGTVTNGRVIYNSTTSQFKVGQNGAWVAFLSVTTPLNSITAPTGSVGMNSQRITGLADPTAAQDAVTKAYADGIAAGLDPKASVKVASTANLALSGAQTIDGISCTAGDRVLVKNQTAPAENGIYTVATGAWARSSDADTGPALSGGAFTFVEQGTINADTGWVATHDGTPTLGTDAISFSKFSAAQAGIGRYAGDVTGDGAASQLTVTHNLGSTDVAVEVWKASSDVKVLVETKRIDSSSVRLDFGAAPSNGEVFRVVVLG